MSDQTDAALYALQRRANSPAAPEWPDIAILRAQQEAEHQRDLTRLSERDVIANAVLRPLTLKAIGYARSRADAIDWPASGDDIARAKRLAKLDALAAETGTSVETDIDTLDEPHRSAMTDLNNRRVWL